VATAGGAAQTQAGREPKGKRMLPGGLQKADCEARRHGAAATGGQRSYDSPMKLPQGLYLPG
jgi:hypothetical protein